jgi:predicted SnoaL-like aldol condensation-catalyzing enzyme
MGSSGAARWGAAAVGDPGQRADRPEEQIPMKCVKTIIAVALVAMVSSVTPSFAQSKTMTAQEQANLKVVLDWWREVLQAGHVELAEKYQTEDYIQHNPGINTGRAEFVKVFSRRAPRDIKPVLDPAPVIQFAKGPYVVLVWEREGKDPKDGSAYKFNFFDIVRVENGKIAEHWDSVFKNPPAAGQPAPAPVIPGIGPKPVAPKNSAAEQKVEDIANTEFKDILQYGHVELADKVMAAGYIQHNPNVPGGREGFKGFFKGRPVEAIKKEWKNEPELIITSGNLTIYMMKRFSADPADPSKVYKWNWFDMVRVDDGMIQEHWDMATKNNPPMNVPMPAGFKEYR